MSPLTNLGIEGVERQDTGAASGFVNVTHQVGGAVGLSLMVSTSEGTTDSLDRFRHSMVIAILLILSALILTLLLQYAKIPTLMKRTFRYLRKGICIIAVMLLACVSSMNAKSKAEMSRLFICQK